MGKRVRISNGKETYTIDSADVMDAANDGYYPTERFSVFNPKTNEAFEIDPSDARDAFADGFVFRDQKKNLAEAETDTRTRTQAQRTNTNTEVEEPPAEQPSNQPSDNGLGGPQPLTANGSQSRSSSGSPFGIQPIQPNAFNQPPGGFSTTPRKRDQALVEAEAINDDVLDWVPDQSMPYTVETALPTSSKFKNANDQIKPILAAVAPFLGAMGVKGSNADEILKNPSNYPIIKQTTKDYYEKAILASQGIVMIPGAFAEAKRVDTEETKALRATLARVNKNIDFLARQAAVRQNPNAPIETIGREAQKTIDPITASNMEIVPDLVKGNYEQQIIGINAKQEHLIMKSEQGKITDKEKQEYAELEKMREDLSYVFPDVRQGEIRSVIMERLQQKGKLSSAIADDTPILALDELKLMLKNPLNPRDVPLIKEMIEDLDFGLGANLKELSLRGVPDVQERYKKYQAERAAYTDYGLVAKGMEGFGGNFEGTAKWIAEKIGVRSDVQRLKEMDVEDVSGVGYVPTKYNLISPKMMLDPKTGQYVDNPNKGDFNFVSLPHKVTHGFGQFAGIIVEGEMAGAMWAGTAGRLISGAEKAITGIAGDAVTAGQRAALASRAGELTEPLVESGRVALTEAAAAGATPAARAAAARTMAGRAATAEEKYLAEAAISETGETAKAAASFQKKLLDEFKIAAPAYTMSYDDNRKEAIRMFGSSPENAGKVDLYSTLASGFEYLTERMFSPFEQAEGLKKMVFKKKFKTELAEVLEGLSARSIGDPATLGTKVKDALMVALKTTWGGALKIGEESSEEFANQLLKGMLSGIQGADMSDRNILAESWNAFIESAASMAFLGVQGGFHSYQKATNNYSNSGFAKRALYLMAANPAQFKDAINQEYLAGNYTREQRDDKLNMVNTAEKARSDWKKVKPYAKNKSNRESQQVKQAAHYVQARANEIALQKEHDLIQNDEVRKKQLASQIKKWQEVQEALLTMPIHYDNEGNPVIPETTTPGLVEVRTDLPPGAQPGDGVTPTISHTGRQEGVSFVPIHDPSQNVTEERVPTVGEVMDRPVLYNGKRGMVVREGQRAVFIEEGTGTIHDTLGVLDDTETTQGIFNSPIDAVGIQTEKTEVGVNDAGLLTVRGVEYFNDYTNPLMAINRDEDGQVQSVDLTDAKGNKVHFRGRRAEDLAYHITLMHDQNQRRARTLSDMAADRDKANNQIAQLHNDNVHEPNAWVAPYGEAMDRQQEMAKNLADTPAEAQAPPAQQVQPVNEELANSLRNMRNDDFVRLHMNETERAEYEQADDLNKAEIIRAKKEQLLKTTPAEQPVSVVDRPIDEVSYDDIINERNEQLAVLQMSENELAKAGLITYTDEQGNPCATKGIVVGGNGSFGDWTIVKDLKGAPSHEYDGVDLNIKGNTVNAEGNELVLKNNNGSYAIIPKKDRVEIMHMIGGNCHKCLNNYIGKLPRNPEVADDGGFFDEGGEETAVVPYAAKPVKTYSNSGFSDILGSPVKSVKSVNPVEFPTYEGQFPSTPLGAFQEAFARKEFDYTTRFGDRDEIKLSGKRIPLTQGRFNTGFIDTALIDEAIAASTRNNASIYDVLTLMGREGGYTKGAVGQNNLSIMTKGHNVDEAYRPFPLYRFLADKKVPGVGVIGPGAFGGNEWGVTNEKAVNDYLTKNKNIINEYQKMLANSKDFGEMNSLDMAIQMRKTGGIKSYNSNDKEYAEATKKDMMWLRNEKALAEYLASKGVALK